MGEVHRIDRRLSLTERLVGADDNLAALAGPPRITPSAALMSLIGAHSIGIYARLAATSQEPRPCDQAEASHRVRFPLIRKALNLLKISIS